MFFSTEEDEASDHHHNPTTSSLNLSEGDFQMGNDDESISTMLSPSIPPFGNVHENVSMDTIVSIDAGRRSADSETCRICPNSIELLGIEEQGHAIESNQLMECPGLFNLKYRCTSAPQSIPSPALPSNQPLQEEHHHSSLSVPSFPEQRPLGVHGVVLPSLKETPQLLRERLEMMERALEGLDDSRGEAYRVALSLNVSYVKDEALRIPFLRADRYDPQEAAERFARHLSIKMELFGTGLLVKSITQENVDMNALRHGHFQILPERDRSGRVVLVHLDYPNDLFVLNTFVKAMFYVMLVAARDAESQRCGCIMVSFLAHKGKVDDLLMIHQHDTTATQLLQSMPLRVDIVHLCTDGIDWRGSSIFHLSAGAARSPWSMYEHVGNYQECLSKLPTFGIRISNFPVNAENEVDTAFHWSVLEKVRLLELHQEERNPQDKVDAGLSIVVIPGQWDILCGRGRRYYEYMGNVRLRCKIADRAEEYDQSNKRGRCKINKDVVDWAMTKGQFLDDTHMGWSVVSIKVARKKVAHMFRDDRSMRVVRANASARSRPATT
eukprot:Nitzschia sp. Nitz4//scaffold16_size188269//29546//31204//NITZ4_001775-RA/size188269-processed-gene-0.43-mRNA-1//-1//CDS//3329538467//3774//frame0